MIKPIFFTLPCNKSLIILKICSSYFKTPRNTIKEFVSMLSILEQNPSTKWQDLLGVIDIKDDIAINDEFDTGGDDSDLVDI